MQRGGGNHWALFDGYFAHDAMRRRLPMFPKSISDVQYIRCPISISDVRYIFQTSNIPALALAEVRYCISDVRYM